jgi:putative metalloprotease
VYLNPELNAFATADGSVRVYSGLMDLLNDDELRSVLGHEMGHVVLGHAKDRTRLAAVTELGKETAGGAAGSKYGAAGQILAQQGAQMIEQVIHAQFSQSQEESADDYGLKTLIEKKKNPIGAVSALRKLAQVNGAESSILATHPDPVSRARRLISELRAR